LLEVFKKAFGSHSVLKKAQSSLESRASWAPARLRVLVVLCASIRYEARGWRPDLANIDPINRNIVKWCSNRLVALTLSRPRHVCLLRGLRQDVADLLSDLWGPSGKKAVDCGLCACIEQVHESGLRPQSGGCEMGTHRRYHRSCRIPASKKCWQGDILRASHAQSAVFDTQPGLPPCGIW
jgi:hypothetical protein